MKLVESEAGRRVPRAEIVIAPALIYRFVAHEEIDLPVDQGLDLLAAGRVRQAPMHAHQCLNAVGVAPNVIEGRGVAPAQLGQMLHQPSLAAVEGFFHVPPVAAGFDQGADTQGCDRGVERLVPARDGRVNLNAAFKIRVSP